MKKLFSFISGAMIGGLVGGVFVLLLTPYRGDDFRLQLIERFDSLRNNINQASATKRIELETQLAAMRAPKVKP